MYKKGELSRRMLDERTAGLPSIGFLDADTDSLGSDVTLDERYHDPNDKGSVTYRYLLREKFSVVTLQSLKTLLPP